MLKVIVPDDKNKIKKCIALLELQISKDTNPHDKEIHLCALKKYKDSLKRGVNY